MGNEFSNMMSAFWATIMDKLNENKDKKEVINDVIKEICRYFNFGCSFVYICNDNQKASLFAAYHAYLDYEHLTPVFNIKKVLGDKLFEKFLEERYIAFDRLTDKTELDTVCGEQFNAKSMILVPLVNKDGKLIAFVGMADRRGERREGDQDIIFAYYILVVLGNYLRIYLAQNRNVKTMNKLTKILNNTGIEVYVVDYYTDEILYTNDIFTNHYGSDLIGKKCYDVLFPGQEMPCSFCPKEDIVTKDLKPRGSKAWNRQMQDGTYRKFISNAFYWVDGRLAQSISSIDITEAIMNEEKLRYYSKHDALTGLGNRHKLLLDCDDGIEILKKNHKEGFLLFADLNKFKAINDKYGHVIGDALLEEVGRYFNTNPETKDITYRYAGDEFVILLYGKNEDEVKQIMDDIYKRFEEPWIIDGNNLECTISIGVTRYTGETLTTSDLLHHADMKMYEKKQAIND